VRCVCPLMRRRGDACQQLPGLTADDGTLLLLACWLWLEARRGRVKGAASIVCRRVYPYSPSTPPSHDSFSSYPHLVPNALVHALARPLPPSSVTLRHTIIRVRSSPPLLAAALATLSPRLKPILVCSWSPNPSRSASSCRNFATERRETEAVHLRSSRRPRQRRHSPIASTPHQRRLRVLQRGTVRDIDITIPHGCKPPGLA